MYPLLVKLGHFEHTALHRITCQAPVTPTDVTHGLLRYLALLRHRPPDIPSKSLHLNEPHTPRELAWEPNSHCRP